MKMPFGSKESTATSGIAARRQASRLAQRAGGSGVRSLLVVAAACAVSCGMLSDDDAVRLVRAYDARLVEAYRTSDHTLMFPVSSDAEAKKLAGLIGVKRDVGVTLDAQLLDLQVRRVERRDGWVVVATEERWYYQDRRIGTGERVAQDSTDRYRMRYFIRRQRDRWVVDHVEFETPPEVARTELPIALPGSLHGVMTRPPDPEPQRRSGGASR